MKSEIKNNLRTIVLTTAVMLAACVQNQAASKYVGIEIGGFMAFSIPEGQGNQGSASLTLADASINEVRTNPYEEGAYNVAVDPFGPATATLEVGVEYTMSFVGVWVYGASHASIDLLDNSCYTLSVTPTSLNVPGGESSSKQWTVKVLEPDGAVTFGKPHDGWITRLPADGVSRISAHFEDKTVSSWTFEGPSLGCQIFKPSGENFGIVTAGLKPGKVTVKAITTDSCEYTGILELYDCGNGDCEGCATGGGGSGGFSPSLGAGPMTARVSLGRDSVARVAEALDIVIDDMIEIDNDIEYPYARKNVRVLRDPEGPKMEQIETPDGVFIFMDSDSQQSNSIGGALEIELYDWNDVSQSGGGWWEPDAMATALRRVVIDNFQTQIEPMVYEKRVGVQVYSEGTLVEEYLYQQDVSSSVWSVSDVESADWGDVNVTQGQRTVKTWDTGSVRVREIYSDSTLIYKLGEEYSAVGGTASRVTSATEGGFGATRTTSYSYDGNGMLTQAVYPDGSWEKHVYTDGRLTVSYRPLMNLATSPSTDTSKTRRTVFYYDYDDIPDLPGSEDVVDPGDDPDIYPLLARCEIEYIKTTEIGRIYRKVHDVAAGGGGTGLSCGDRVSLPQSPDEHQRRRSRDLREKAD